MPFQRLIMAENVTTVVEDIGNEVVALRLQLNVEDTPKLLAVDENETSNGCRKDENQKREQELPELIKRKDENKIMAPSMPYINLSELATILRDPSMPSQKILKQVADKIMLKTEESESDDGSVSSGGGVVGMRGLLDCIFEVSFWHEDSASSDDDDNSFKRIPPKIPCKFCNKTFRSTMKRNTHILVVHAEQDSSVLNIRRLSANEADRKEKSHSQKKHTRCMPKSNCDAKTHHSSAAERKHNSTLQSENTPIRKRRPSFSKSQSREENAGKSAKYPSDACQKKKESLPNESSCRTQSCGLVTNEEGDIIVSQNEIVHSIYAGETDNCPVETTCRESLLVNRNDTSQLAEAPCSEKCSEKRPDETGNQQSIDTRMDAADTPSTSKTDTRQSTAPSGRKRKSTSPLAESVSSSYTSSNPKCSKKNTQKKSASLTEHIQSDSSPTEGTPNEERLKSRAGKAATLRSFRRL